MSDWDDLTHPDDTPRRTTHDPYKVRVCKCGREKAGDNLQIVHRTSGKTEYRCVRCHRARQRKHDRAAAARRAG